MTFVTRHDDGDLHWEDRDGIAWYEAKPHRWWRRHRVQTRGGSLSLGVVERCRCGKIRRGGTRRWFG